MARSRRHAHHAHPARRAAALVAAGALILAACAEDPTVEPDPPVATPTEPPAEDTEEPEELEEPDGDEPDGGEPDETEEPEQPPVDEPETDDPEAAPTPDPAALDDPCAGHEDRTDESFIEVVSPVDGQQAAAGAVELVGCSNVFEANVQWSLYDSEGIEVDVGFTTAECGSGCVGAFFDSVSVDAVAGEPSAELHVYAEDAADGARDHLTEIELDLT